jgi:2-dehydropantoate 2-reductase
MDSVYSKNECSFISRGELVIGVERKEQKQDVQTLQKVFEEYDVPFVISADIVKDQYSKLMFNCGINQVCAAYQTTYGQAASDPFLHDLFLKAMQEAKEVINKEGVDLTDQDLQDWDAALQKLQKGSMPSMAQDILAGRKTELDLFSGTILPLAKKHNIPVPVLSSLKQKIEELEAGF